MGDRSLKLMKEEAVACIVAMKKVITSVCCWCLCITIKKKKITNAGCWWSHAAMKRKITDVGCWCLCCCYNEEKEDHKSGLLVLALLLQRRKRGSPKWIVGACIVATRKKKKITKVGCWCLHCC